MADLTYPQNHFHVRQDGVGVVPADAALDIESGGEFRIGGVAVTPSAAELNALTGITATVAELNATDLSAVGALVKIKKLAISATPTGVEQDTTFNLPAKAVILDVWVDVTTAEATGGTKTLDVGLLTGESGGDPDGFLDGVSVASTGIKRGIPTFTVGSNETFYASTTRGAFFRTVSLAGADAAGDVGTYHERPHLSDSVTAKSVTYTAGSNDFAEFRGDIYILYAEIG